MKHVRSVLSRLTMIWLVASFVTASFVMAMAGAVEAKPEQAHAMHATMPMDAALAGQDSPSGHTHDMHGDAEHAACAMTICCFSDLPDLSALSPDFVLLDTGYVPFSERRLTQSEPERHKKPPKHA